MLSLTAVNENESRVCARAYKLEFPLLIKNAPVHDINIAFGAVEYFLPKPILKGKSAHKMNYDEEVNRLLDEVEEEFLWDDPKKYDFPEDTHHVGSIPDWYRDMLQSKIKEAKRRLEKLSKLICSTSPLTAAHIKRIEEDHSTAFCKMNYPRHPPMHKPWRSTWELRYATKCKETDSNHIHVANCQTLVVEDFNTGVRMDTPNISHHDYPPHVIHVAKLFQDFAKKLNREKSKSNFKEDVNTIDDDWWISMAIVLISSHLNELMIVVRRGRVKRLIPYLKMYFEHVCQKNPNIISVLGFDNSQIGKKLRRAKRNALQKSVTTKGMLVAGSPELKDKIGPLSLRYNEGNHRSFFDSIETMQLGKIIQDYMCLTKETTLLHIGSSFRVLSLIMAYTCEKVIGLKTESPSKQQIEEAEKFKKFNKICNVSFAEYSAEDMVTKCSPLIEQCITVAILELPRRNRLDHVKGVMKALRNLPSIWQVLVYGSFAGKYHKCIKMLTSEDDSMGERYLPMQGCILDKSPTVDNAFDLVILFERKSLIAPQIELFAPGPTVNVRSNSETCIDGSLDAREVKLELPSYGDQKVTNLKEKSDGTTPSSTVTKKKPTHHLDYPSPPLESFIPFPHPPPSVNEEFQFNFPSPPFQRISPFHPNASGPVREHLESRFPNPHIHPDSYPKSRENFQFNCPHPSQEKYSSAPILHSPYLPARDDFQDHYYPPLPPENYYNSPHFPDPHALVGNEFQNHHPPQPPLPVLAKPLLSKNEKPQFYYPPPPSARFPSPPPLPPLPPPEETNSLEKDSNVSSSSQVCEEERVSKIVNAGENVISSVVIKSEPIDSSYCANISEANGTCKQESNEADCGTSSSVAIKSEPTNKISSVNFSETNCQNIALPISIELEPKNGSPIRSPDCEPTDMQISPSPPDFQSMETPIHKPRALSDITPLTVSKNVSVNGSEFPVQTNQSFLDIIKPKVAINVDRELVEIDDSDGENEAIDEEKNKQQKKSETIGVASELPRKHVSTISVLSRKLVRPPRPFPGKYSQSPSPYDRRYRKRSPSPKRFRRSPTPDRRRKRSPVSDRRRERSRRSPLREACGRAKSPRDRRNRRSRSRSPRRR